jgi:hypothetical protein
VLFFYSLDFQFSNRAENLCSQNKTDKTQTAIPQDCLLDARLRLVFPFHRVFTKSTEFPVLFFYSLNFQFSNRAENLCSQNKTDKTQTAIPQDCLLDARLRLVFPFRRDFDERHGLLRVFLFFARLFILKNMFTVCF